MAPPPGSLPTRQLSFVLSADGRPRARRCLAARQPSLWRFWQEFSRRVFGAPWAVGNQEGPAPYRPVSTGLSKGGGAPGERVPGPWPLPGLCCVLAVPRGSTVCASLPLAGKARLATHPVTTSGSP